MQEKNSFHSINLIKTKQYKIGIIEQNTEEKFNHANPDIKKIIDKYHTSFTEFNANTKIIKTNHSIITDGKPVHAKVRQLAPDKLAAAKTIFDDLLKNNIITPSTSEWSSALMLKQKSDKSWRACGDYRALNNITKPDVYPIPLIKDIITRIKNAKFFSKIDLQKAYHQIPIHVNDICKTAITTPFGMFEYRQMPFGLRNAAATFQRFMDKTLYNIPNAVTYLDDILIASPTYEKHLTDIETIIERLQTNGLKLNYKKCEFIKPEINFLGHTLNENGIKPIKNKLEIIKNYQTPKQYAN